MSMQKLTEGMRGTGLISTVTCREIGPRYSTEWLVTSSKRYFDISKPLRYIEATSIYRSHFDNSYARFLTHIIGVSWNDSKCRLIGQVYALLKWEEKRIIKACPTHKMFFQAVLLFSLLFCFCFESQISLPFFKSLENLQRFSLGNWNEYYDEMYAAGRGTSWRRNRNKKSHTGSEVKTNPLVLYLAFCEKHRDLSDRWAKQFSITGFALPSLINGGSSVRQLIMQFCLHFSFAWKEIQTAKQIILFANRFYFSLYHEGSMISNCSLVRLRTFSISYSLEYITRKFVRFQRVYTSTNKL